MTDLPFPLTFDRAGKYRLGTLLGQGGMAEVYRGCVTGEAGFERTVAIKRVLPGFSNNEQFAAMFINEARLASLLHHPNIVAVLDLDRDVEGRLFQVLEFVEGRDLEKLAQSGRIPEPIVYQVMAGVLRGLDHAHAARNPQTGRPLGIVHRDCTPGNVLIDYDGNAKVSDFGVAKAVLATGASIGSLKGKPSYMSPEQVTTPDQIDARSDLFAVGVMMWELLAGYRPFRGETVPEVISQVAMYGRAMTDIPAIETVNPNVPGDVARLVADLLARDRNGRPQTAGAALARLAPFVPHDGTQQLARMVAARFPRARDAHAASGPATVAGHAGAGPHGTPIAVQARDPVTTTPTGLGQIAEAATGFPAPAGPPLQRRRWPLAVAGGAIAAIGVVLGVMFANAGSAHRPAATTGQLEQQPTPDAAISPPLDSAPTAAVAQPEVTRDAGIPLDAASTIAEPEVPADAGVRTRRHPPHGGSASGGNRVHEVILGGSGNP